MLLWSSWQCPSWHCPQCCLGCHAVLRYSELALGVGGVFDELGCDSQQLLYHPQEMGETWGWGAAWLSPGQSSARGRPWATHKHKEFKKQMACGCFLGFCFWPSAWLLLMP